tara:strand:+ start:1033 stop:1158 length:126 start_codon:yes stop_codon:yes gene_type:complete
MIKKIKNFFVNFLIKLKSILVFLKNRKKKNKENNDDIYPLF